MTNRTEKLIVALDVKDMAAAQRLMRVLCPGVRIFKIGSVLFTAYGPKIIALVRKKGAAVFLDLKFHDIPNTVAGAVRQAVRLKVKMLTLHTCGGAEMLKAAAEAAADEAKRSALKKPLLLGVTVLTSDKPRAGTRVEVLRRAKLAQRSGLDGIVCSVHEAKAVRRACGRGFVIVTPGIRQAGADAGDQKRVATAQAAFSAGADYIVVGRPVIQASDPSAAAKDILKGAK